jgi:hypothetical protein
METPTFHKELLAVATAANASGSVGYPGDPAVTRQIGFHVKWAAFATAGTVVIEVADSTAYTGTWATATTIAFAGTAPVQQYFTMAAAGLAWRARISSAVLPATTGVSVTVVGN